MLLTHTDLDGIGSAAVYIRFYIRSRGFGKGEYVVFFAEPEELGEALEEILDLRQDQGSRIAIFDLAPNPGNLDRVELLLRMLKERGVEVEWYDHHVWSEEALSRLSRLARLRIDTSTCSTGAVVSASEIFDQYARSLASAVCSADLWGFWDSNSPWLYRLAIFRRDDLWKKILIDIMLRADSVESIVEWGRPYVARIFDRELRLYNVYRKRTRVSAIDGVRVVSVVKRHREMPTSHLANYMLSSYKSDIAVVINPRGPVSFRSRRCDVRAVAEKLGGGGHRPASGAFVKIPLFLRLLSTLGFDYPLHVHVMSRVCEAIKSADLSRICQQPSPGFSRPEDTN